MRMLVLIVFTLAGAGLAVRSFYTFPWPEKPTRIRYLTTLAIYLAIGGSIGWLAGGWLAGRVPD